MDETEIIYAIYLALKKDERFKNLSYDGDHKSSSIAWTGPDGQEWLISSRNVQDNS